MLNYLPFKKFNNSIILISVSWLWMPLLLSAETIDFRFERMWPRLEQPWYFNNPTGIATSVDGQVYVVDSDYQRVQVFDTEGRFIRSWGNEQFYPWGIAVNNGVIYVTTLNQIQVFDREGQLLHTWGSEGSGNGQFLKPRGLAVDQTGLIYIADSTNNRVQVLDATGRFVRTWGSSGTTTGKFIIPQDVAIDSDGQVYVLDSGNARIQVFNSQGQFLRTWGSQGISNGQFGISQGDDWLNGPQGIAISKTGTVYVIDTLNARIQAFNQQGNFLYTWGVYGSTEGAFSGVNDLAIDNIGRLYVTDSWNDRIQIFNFENVFNPLMGWQSHGYTDERFNMPTGVALDNSEKIYVVDQNNVRIKVFNNNGELVRAWGEYGDGIGQMIGPSDVVVSNSGKVYVSDEWFNRIHVFDIQGNFLFSWGNDNAWVAGTSNGKFSYPSGVAIDNTEQVYVADTKNNRIQVFDSQGQFVRKWGSFGTGSGQFKDPKGIDLDNEGLVYVVDAGNHRIQVFNNQGQFVRQWGGYGTQSGKFYWPESIAIDNTGRVYVTDNLNGRVQVFTSSGTLISSFGNLGSNAGEFGSDFSLAVTKSGNKLYIADTSNNRIQSFTRHIVTVANAKPPRALIIGGRTAIGDALDNNILSQVIMKSYNALRYQGYRADVSSDEIRVLWNGPPISLANGEILLTYKVTADDFTTGTELTNWAKNSERLLIYIIGHGIKNIFYLDNLNGTALNAQTFNTWLNQIQPSLTDDITVIYEACHSGSFLPVLFQNKRTLLTSADSDQRALFINRGLNSYSYSLWTALELGFDLKASHDKAVSDLNITQRGITQTPQLDANYNGVSNEIGDFQAAQNRCIGIGVNTDGQLTRTCIVSVARIPSIIRVTPPFIVGQYKENTANASLWLEVSEFDAPSIASAWIVINRSDFIADTSQAFDNLPIIDLIPDQILGKLRWVGRYVAGDVNSMGEIQLGFNVPGKYNLAYYVKNTDGILSAPIMESITRYACGNADDNSLVNIIDALAVARHVVSLSPPPSINTTAADVDKNGQITIADALLIAKRVIGLNVIGTCWN